MEGGVMKSLNDSFYKTKCSISIIERKGFNMIVKEVVSVL